MSAQQGCRPRLARLSLMILLICDMCGLWFVCICFCVYMSAQRGCSLHLALLVVYDLADLWFVWFVVCVRCFVFVFVPICLRNKAAGCAWHACRL